MQKYFITIMFLLLSLLIPHMVEARLTLGVVTGPTGSVGPVTSAQANSFASLLAEKLNEDVVVKELSDTATLLNWLDRFTMLDLALLSTKDVEFNPGRFLLVGPLGGQKDLKLVIRQGVEGDLPQRLGAIVRETGLEPWRADTVAEGQLQLSQEESTPLTEPKSEMIASRADSQDVLTPSRGRAQAVREPSAYREILPAKKESLAKKLVLGVFPDSKGLVNSLQQAEQLAAYLEKTLPVSVRIKEFSDSYNFTEWFIRYRMVDLAVLPPSFTKKNLGGDYTPVATFSRTVKPGVKEVELFVMRHGQNEDMLEPLQSALFNMMETADGLALLAELNINEVNAPDVVFDQKVAFERETEVDVKVEQPFSELVEEPIEELPSMELPEPTEPMPPQEVIVKMMPALPEVTKQGAVLSLLEAPMVTLPRPEFIVPPADPIRPDSLEGIKNPDVTVRMEVPLQPDVPPLPDLIPTVKLPELPGGKEPVLVQPTIEPPDVVSTPPEFKTPPAEPVSPAQVESPETPETTQLTEPLQPEIPSILETIAVVPASEATEIGLPPVQDMPTTVVLPETKPTGTVALEEELVSSELMQQNVTLIEPEIESVLVAGEEPVNYEQQRTLEDLSSFADPVTADDLAEVNPVIVDENVEAWSDEDFAAVLGENKVAAVVAQPDIPHEFRPSGVPIVRPGRISRPTTAAEDELLVASLPEPLKVIEPPRPPNLLPEPEPEPGIVYVVPFVAIMVPDEVNARIFDQFVDTLNQEGESLGLQFVILKDGLQRVSPEWLSARKYVTGEIYAYVEDSGCCSTDLRTKARLTYRRPNQRGPTFGYDYPVKRFFDHDLSSIDVERVKLADDIAGTLSGELLKALRK